MNVECTGCLSFFRKPLDYIRYHLGQLRNENVDYNCVLDVRYYKDNVRIICNSYVSCEYISVFGSWYRYVKRGVAMKCVDQPFFFFFEVVLVLFIS